MFIVYVVFCGPRDGVTSYAMRTDQTLDLFSSASASAAFAVAWCGRMLLVRDVRGLDKP